MFCNRGTSLFFLFSFFKLMVVMCVCVCVSAHFYIKPTIKADMMSVSTCQCFLQPVQGAVK